VTYGLFIDDRIFISGDTVYDTDLIDLYADRAEYMFHDCSFMPNPVHASLPELRMLHVEIKKKMFLMHYPDKSADHDFMGFAGLTRQGVRYIFD